MGRFEREAHLLASLNHPNIAAIYGFEDSGEHRAIVMELIQGETLQGPLPIAEVLRLAKQIAEAMEYAHDKGVIHRDLKPANIKLTQDGQVKVLDFGLAKALDDAGHSSPEGDPANSLSPTLTMGATQAGVILGTAAYMAPEQAKGKRADRKADIWSFGVVLYEMLTGTRVFAGETMAETLASVMKEQLTFDDLPKETPPALRKLVKRCLERDLKRRVQSMGEVRIGIEDILSGAATEEVRVIAQPVPAKTSWIPWAVAAVGIAAAFGLGVLYFTRAPQTAAAPAMRFALDAPPGVALTANRQAGTTAVVSPDGRYIAFVADKEGAGPELRALWLRSLDSLTAQQLDQTEGATDPFWSPDSQNIAFFAGGKLKRIAISGGAPVNVCDSQEGQDLGGTWFQQEGSGGQSEGVILFGPNAASPILRVPAGGGVPTPVTKVAQGEQHKFPQFLPGGQHFQYWVQGGPKPGIYVQTLGSEERTFLLETPGRASFAPPDYLLYMRETTLLAQHVDWDALKPLGEPVSVTDRVRSDAGSGGNAFSVSTTGALTFRAGDAAGEQQYRWYSRDGKPDGPPLARADSVYMMMAPDNKHAVLGRGGSAGVDLWLADLPSGVLSRLTSDPGDEWTPQWSPDSRRIAYLKTGSDGKRGVYQMLVGSGKDSLVCTCAEHIEHWTGEGLLLRTGNTVSLLPAPQENAAQPASEKPRTLLDVKYTVGDVHVSPDGKWVAYTSMEGGPIEVWVAAFPGFTDRRKVSSGNGGRSLWRPDGKELLYLAGGDNVMSIDVKAGATFESGAPKLLLKAGPGVVMAGGGYYRYAISGDGKRLLVRESIGGAAPEAEKLYLILNWPSLLGK